MLTYNTLRARRTESIGTETVSLQYLERRVADPGYMGLNLHPDYQREHVWTDRQASLFIGFLAEGGECPPIFVQRWPMNRRGDQPVDEVVDGQQRLTALLRFGTNQIPMETPRGEVQYLRDFSPEDQRILKGSAGLRVTFQMVQCRTRAEVLALYIKLNRGGTPHTEDEIERVRGLLAAAEKR